MGRNASHTHKESALISAISPVIWQPDIVTAAASIIALPSLAASTKGLEEKLMVYRTLPFSCGNGWSTVPSREQPYDIGKQTCYSRKECNPGAHGSQDMTSVAERRP